MNKLLVLYVVALAFAICASAAPQGCTPFGLRIALGRNYFTKQENETASIWFNTGLQCPKSYITVQKDSSIKKIYCSTKKLAYSNYSTFVHRCSIDFIQKGDNYEYMAFGWTGNASDPTIPFSNSNIKTHLLGKNEDVIFVSIADWSYLEVKAGIYDRLDNALNALLKSGENYILYIAGDVAYDLSSNNGKNYQNFLIMLSQVSSVWPLIIATGNHEYNTPNDFMLFKETFQTYNLTVRNITTLDLQTFTFIIFDPYSILYENATTKQLYAQFKQQLKSASKKKPIITSSHYPLACSGSSSHCKQMRTTLKDFFEHMIDHNVVLYIGAHYHTYERLYPYEKGGNFTEIPSPYDLTNETNYLPSVVEGIAGNDKSIVQSYSKISHYTAALSYNHTGYGIMRVNKSQLTYQHYLSTQWAKPIDSMTVRYSQLFKEPIYNLRSE